jgi:hypothetical protein
MEKLNSISLQSDFIRALDNDMTFKIDRGQEASLDISTSQINVQIKAFNLNDYSEIMQQIRTGDFKINIKASCIVIRTFVRILERIN